MKTIEEKAKAYDEAPKAAIVAHKDEDRHLKVILEGIFHELKEVRYKFMPNDMQVAQIFPPREEFVNVHENCFHLFELDHQNIETK